ncbi:MAG: hypothetical protein P8X63_15430 [Desulfuromonadaceae bacterium]
MKKTAAVMLLFLLGIGILPAWAEVSHIGKVKGTQGIMSKYPAFYGTHEPVGS